jgi:hypothetical protein
MPILAVYTCLLTGSAVQRSVGEVYMHHEIQAIAMLLRTTHYIFSNLS